jgi:AcrR family transcriptional regulator
MGRWEPNAGERLERAALALFTERGYEATTVADIADRAGLSKSTFFRHFADKREVLFGAPNMLAERFCDAILAAPPAAMAIDCIAAALESAAPGFTSDRRDLAAQRQAVIAASSELRERGLLKEASLVSFMAGALCARGTDELTARLAAELGILAFNTARSRWASPENRQPFTEIAHAALRDLQARAAALGAGAGVSA